MQKSFKFIGGFLIVLCFLFGSAPAHADTMTFPAGSYIIPQDNCWQPNNDPAMISQTTCTMGYDPNKNDQGFFQATGLIYDILQAGYPVYWIINPSKTTPLGIDMSITKSGSAPAVTILNSALANSGANTMVQYMGGPFVLDANTVDPTVLKLLAKYSQVKIHQSNYDFSAQVTKVLSGVPPVVAVLGEGSTQILTNYLFASGLANDLYTIFDYVTDDDIAGAPYSTTYPNGALTNYQLLWAPHWQIDGDGISVAEEHAVVNNIYNFLVGGNAGFFECASIQTMERAYNVGGQYLNSICATDICPNEDLTGYYSPPTSSTLVDQYQTGQGLLTSPTYTGSKGRIDQNGGNMPASAPNNLVYEDATDPLNQCGGWNYIPTIGVTMDFRASQQYNPSYTFNSTIERYIHDPDSKAITGYAPKGYNYYLGGRVNGSPTQGFVAYLGGHQYVACTNNTTATPNARTFEFDFNASLMPSTNVTVEAVYAGCTAGKNCPTASFSIMSQTGTLATDGTVYVDTDSSQYAPIYNSSGAITGYAITNVVIGNYNTSNSQTVTSIQVSFSGNPSTTLLTTMWDTSDGVSPPDDAVCSPNEPFTATCNPLQTKEFNYNFSSNLASGTTVTVEAVYGTCTQGATGNCPKASYKIGGSGVIGSDSNIKIDPTLATWSTSSYALQNVVISNLNTSATETLTSFNVYFPGNPSTELTTIQNVTSTPTTVCTADAYSTAACPPKSVTPNVVTNAFYYSASMASGTIYVEAVFSGCTEGSTCPKASYNLSSRTGTSSTDALGQVKLDMTSAAFQTQSRPTAYLLNNVLLSNLTSNTITITEFVVTWSGTAKLNNIYQNGSSIWRGSGTSSIAYISGLSENLTVNTSQTSIAVPLAEAPSPLAETLGPAVSECVINWAQSNTCGMKFVLNTLIGLQFQLIPYEYDKAGDVQEGNTLYKADFEYPGYKGHVYAINMISDPAYRIWDAGSSNVMPFAGSASPPSPSSSNATRYIFTTTTGTTMVSFDTTNVGTAQSDQTKLWYYLDPADKMTLTGVEALINSVRGRNNTSSTNIVGTGEMTKRLGGIEHSTPAVMTGSPLVAGALHRDQVVFVGADDGMLHAFYAGSWNSSLNNGNGGYTNGTGAEIWAFIPNALLSSLQNETFTNCSPGGTTPCPVFSVAVSVDGSPALGDFFVSPDGNPNTPKVWKTILTGTAKIMVPGSTSSSVNQGIVFALDVSNPYAPVVLWEQSYNSLLSHSAAPPYINYLPTGAFPSSYITSDSTGTFDPNMGYAQSTAIGRVQVGTTLDTYVFLTSQWIRQVNVGTATAPVQTWGLSVFALDFFDGSLKWETKILYTGNATGVNDTPPVPVLMDYGNTGTYNFVIFGDMEGRLWVLNTLTGTNLTSLTENGGPAFTVGAGAVEPIGVAVALSGHDIVFGTGGRDSLQGEATYNYHLFAISIDDMGNVTDLWNPPYALNQGEKVWSPPVIDANGYVYVGTASGYTDVAAPNTIGTTSTGRLIVLNLGSGQLAKTSTGAVISPVNTGSAVLGNIAVGNNHVSLQLFNGQIIQVGASGSSTFTSNVPASNPVKTLWWRKL